MFERCPTSSRYMHHDPKHRNLLFFKLSLENMMETEKGHWRKNKYNYEK